MERKSTKHLVVWIAIEKFAHSRNLSCSALAKLSRMDATSFNRSKRWTGTGKPRWPSTHSIAKILDATGASIEEFVSYIPRSHAA